MLSMRNHALVLCCGVTLVVLAGAGPTRAPDIDLTALIHETQKLVQGSGETGIVWWMPEEFWGASLSQNKRVTAAGTEAFLKTVRPYTIVAVFRGTVGPFGGVTYESEEQIRTGIRLVDMQGTSYSPLTDEQLSADLKSLLQIMKPMLANMLGPLGQNMQFCVFSGTTRAGAPIVNTTQKGHFKITLEKREYVWRLPLDSVLPGKVCPECHEPCKGSWNFCPWCGTKLPQK
jgi:hypothetical protein